MKSEFFGRKGHKYSTNTGFFLGNGYSLYFISLNFRLVAAERLPLTANLKNLAHYRVFSFYTIWEKENETTPFPQFTFYIYGSFMGGNHCFDITES